MPSTENILHRVCLKEDFYSILQRFIDVLCKTKDPSCEGLISEAEASPSVRFYVV